MSITEDHKIQLMYGMAGPVANIRHNLGEVVRSISCTVELQIDNAKRSWKVSTAPLRKVLTDMVRSGKNLRSETREVSRSFLALNEQVASQSGYSVRSARDESEKRPHSTQELFEGRTRMRCSYIIDESITRCKAWFEAKYQSCLNKIAVPVISHLLCIPMKFSFICHLAKIMNAWCRDKIPVDGNFGQTFDNVNGSVDNLNQDFTADLVIKEEHQTMLVGANISHEHLVDEVNEQVALHGGRISTSMSVLRVLLSCTFVMIFASAHSYTNSFNQDVRFDNIYITRYFRQIDARRRKQKKRTLLPLRRAEIPGYIDPCHLKFQPAEAKNVMSELLGCLPSLIFLLLAFCLDYLLYNIFSTIRHHSFVEYSFSSSHHLEVIVGGETMMARLLRSTIGALNTSSKMEMEATNIQCLPEPRGMSRVQYQASCISLGALFLLCLVQVYAYRIRRVIAAFYFPKREKKRILFLYNEMLRQRVAFITVQRKRIIQRSRRHKRLEKPLVDRLGHWFPFLKRFLRLRCILCGLPETPNSVLCATPECGTIYCRLCWKDMGEVCFACCHDDVISDDVTSEGETGYAH
ncbi:E3 ubiquitin-protein ligase DCST1 isoform X2 [Sphaerodactylus townsendi]|uniref:E3 ubiquitin-protein ligase DCST1 isoform X2 n=1 Tax=Sphaerodactylus townsendi TaxID=933632 RepID=UPI002026A249|nr:E3 ubiquitin-protein ligase DCST1 isoform X2 [Sphaerodactylus townsendi]